MDDVTLADIDALYNEPSQDVESPRSFRVLDPFERGYLLGLAMCLESVFGNEARALFQDAPALLS